MKITARNSSGRPRCPVALFDSLESRMLLSVAAPACAAGTISVPPSGTLSVLNAPAVQADSSLTLLNAHPAAVVGPPTVSISPAQGKASEINNGISKGVAKLTISCTGSTSAPLDVHLTLTGTAVLTTNYNLSSNGNALTDTVTIPAGAKSATVLLVPIDDSTATGPLTATISLATDAQYTVTSTIAKTHSTVTIADSAPVVSVSASRPTSSEKGSGSGQFTISRTGATSQSLAVSLDLEGTAVRGTDYYTSGLSGSTLVIPAGAKSASFSIVAINNHIHNVPNLNVMLTPLSDTSFSINPQKASATVTILDAG